MLFEVSKGEFLDPIVLLDWEMLTIIKLTVHPLSKC